MKTRSFFLLPLFYIVCITTIVFGSYDIFAQSKTKNSDGKLEIFLTDLDWESADVGWIAT